jgi:hypothetical protein
MHRGVVAITSSCGERLLNPKCALCTSSRILLSGNSICVGPPKDLIDRQVPNKRMQLAGASVQWNVGLCRT